MTKFHILIIRLVIGLVIAVVMSRFFFGAITPLYVVGLMIFLVGMAYITEAWRRKRQAKDREPKQSS